MSAVLCTILSRWRCATMHKDYFIVGLYLKKKRKGAARAACGVFGGLVCVLTCAPAYIFAHLYCTKIAGGRK